MSRPNLKVVPDAPEKSDERISREVDVAIVGYDRWRFGPSRGGQPKLTVRCKIMEPTSELGQELCAYYRLERYDKRKRCYAGKRSKIVRDFGRLLPDYIDEMPLPLSRLKNLQVRAKTAWVTTAADGEPLAPQQQYERIRCFLLAH